MASLPEPTPAIHAWFAAWNARDLDGVYACVHPRIRVVPRSEMLTPPGTSYAGRAGLASLFAQIERVWPGVTIEPGEIELHGRWAVVTTRVTGADDGRASGAVRFLVDRGRIVRVETFRTAEEARGSIDGDGAAAPTVLTAREREIFELLARGLNARQVADRLILSPATVRTHVHNGAVRLGATTRVQAVALAVDLGEIEPGCC